MEFTNLQLLPPECGPEMQVPKYLWAYLMSPLGFQCLSMLLELGDPLAGMLIRYNLNYLVLR